MAQTLVKKIGTQVWIHCQGRTFLVDTPSARKRKRTAHGSAEVDGKIRAPMPGKILKVLVSPGVLVKHGETLLVMEAMKMEYALKAPLDGKVKTVKATVGSTVVLEEILVELEAPAK
ncbi:MAG: acetyl-CoA carboxylase biotin carboxyl carrier protein subunit [Oligoflexia bacterium]|nr:acetyl-CoA carboxylase biotin carboxyl carrier protein subunit [Oligoflexia bacterium]